MIISMIFKIQRNSDTFCKTQNSYFKWPLEMPYDPQPPTSAELGSGAPPVGADWAQAISSWKRDPIQSVFYFYGIEMDEVPNYI